MIDELEHCTHKDAYLVNLKLQHYRWLASKLIGIYGDKQLVQTDSKVEITWNIPEQRSYENEINITPGPKLHTLAKENLDKSYKELEKIRADSSVAETH
jgi:hypothetical protein